MKSLTRHIPNFITLCSLLSGTVGIVAVFQWDVRYGAYFIWVGALLDFLDGFFARLLGAYSEIGKELDSLADMVTFGLLPAFMMFGILSAFPHVHPFLPAEGRFHRFANPGECITPERDSVYDRYRFSSFHRLTGIYFPYPAYRIFTDDIADPFCFTQV